MKTQTGTIANDETCKVVCFNEGLVNDIKSSMIPAGELRNLAEFYKLLGNPTRLKIIFALARGELCVCDVAHILGLSIPATSQQLKMLRQQGLLRHRTDGRMAYYSLVNPRLLEAIQGDVAFIEMEA